MIPPLSSPRWSSASPRWARAPRSGESAGRALAWFITASLHVAQSRWSLVNLFRPGDGLDPERRAADWSASWRRGDFTLRQLRARASFPTSVSPRWRRTTSCGHGLRAVLRRRPAARADCARREQLMVRDRGRCSRADAAAHRTTSCSSPRSRSSASWSRTSRRSSARDPRQLTACCRRVLRSALLMLWALLLAIGAMFLAGKSSSRSSARPASRLLMAFSTASSEAALPTAVRVADRLGVPRRISRFVLPLGPPLNQNGTMMYESVRRCCSSRSLTASTCRSRAAVRDAADADGRRRRASPACRARAWW